VNSRRIVFSFAPLVIMVVGCFFPALSSAQDSSSTSALAAKEVAGKKIFYQRCSVCHLTPLRARSTGTKAFGPQLKGFVHDADSEQQAADIIRNGKGTVMPGFQYGLRPVEIDDIVAYLKTYR
jgi:mono/diheme cytochrome c family protein